MKELIIIHGFQQQQGNKIKFTFSKIDSRHFIIFSGWLSVKLSFDFVLPAAFLYELIFTIRNQVMGVEKTNPAIPAE